MNNKSTKPVKQNSGLVEANQSRRALMSSALGLGVAGSTAFFNSTSADAKQIAKQLKTNSNFARVDTVLGQSPSESPDIRISGDLATMTAEQLGATLVFAEGCIEADDGAGGWFRWVDHGRDDGGTVIVPNASLYAIGGCWKRIFSGPVNAKWFGARGDRNTDDTLAIQNAINSGFLSPTPPWLGDNRPEQLAAQVGIKAVYIPGGMYLITAPLRFESLMGFLFYGEGTTTKLYVDAKIDTAIDVNGVRWSEFRDFEILGTPNGSAKQCLWYRWEIGRTGSTSQNHFKNIGIINLKFKVGFKIGTDDSYVQEDQSYWWGCRVSGRRDTEEDKSWYQAGWQVGTGKHANNLIHAIYSVNATHLRYGIHLRASQLAIYGGIIQSNEVDLKLDGLTTYFYVNGIRSEQSRRFMQSNTYENGVTTAGGTVRFLSIVDCDYHIPIENQQLAEDGHIIDTHWPGNYYLRNFYIAGGKPGGNILPYLIFDGGGGRAHVTIDGLYIGENTGQNIDGLLSHPNTTMPEIVMRGGITGKAGGGYNYAEAGEVYYHNAGPKFASKSQGVDAKIVRNPDNGILQILSTNAGVQFGENEQQRLGFFGASPVEPPEVTGSWSNGSAGQSLVEALTKLGLVKDSTDY